VALVKINFPQMEIIHVGLITRGPVSIAWRQTRGKSGAGQNREKRFSPIRRQKRGTSGQAGGGVRVLGWQGIDPYDAA
jgi:hypothetical protein